MTDKERALFSYFWYRLRQCEKDVDSCRESMRVPSSGAVDALELVVVQTRYKLIFEIFADVVDILEIDVSSL